MKTFHCLVLIGAACAIAGCPRREPTLDEAIDALPDEMKPAFVEMLKRDFFIFSDATNDFTRKNYPPELKEAYWEVQERMGEKEAFRN